MNRHVDPSKVVVWQIEFRFSTKDISLRRGTRFVQALQNESADQLYDRLFDEVDAELREDYGDYRLEGCDIRPAIMKKE